MPFKGWGKGFGKGFGRPTRVEGDPKLMVYVGNLAFSCHWQELKTHMSAAGTVEFAKVLTDDGSDWGRSRGVGCVRYATEEEANRAIATLSETELQGRNILVDHWGRRSGAGPDTAAELALGAA